MAEYISKQNVLDYLNGYLHSVGEDDDTLFNRGQRRALTNSIQDILAVKAADVQPVDRWIKADVSLPVYGGMVLVCDRSKNIRLGIYTDMGWCSQFGNPMMCKITHWQPIPEPPKE